MPYCELCGRCYKNVVMIEGHLACSNCRCGSGVCSLCGKKTKVLKKNTKGEGLCVYCIPKIQCSKCGSICHLHDRKNNLCKKCYDSSYSKPKKKCCICGRNKVSITSDPILCGKCYAKQKKREKCVECGHRRQVYRRRDGLPLCESCGKHKEQCSVCGNIKIVKKRDKLGRPICQTCHYRERRKNDEIFRLRCQLSCRLWHAMKNQGGKRGSLVVEYGIDVKKILDEIGTRPGPNWDLDHIIPVSAFDLKEKLQVRAAFSPENLQWLPRNENQKKSSSFNREDFDFLMMKVGTE